MVQCILLCEKCALVFIIVIYFIKLYYELLIISLVFFKHNLIY